MDALVVEGLTKRFGTVVALDDVSFGVRSGEVHALVGENGSGKSTLCNVLFGSDVIAETGGYEGRITVAGRQVSIGDPRAAHAAGIALVHQELSQVDGLSVAENVVLGREPVASALPLAPVDRTASRQRAAEALRCLDVDLDVRQRVADLPLGSRQLVEAAREFDRDDVSLLVLDEPSAALSAAEGNALAGMIRSAADSGVGVLLVSHRLDEVLGVADRVTVLRDGHVVTTVPAEQTDAATLARLMVGDERDRAPRARADMRLGDVALAVDGLRVAMPGDPLRGLSFTARAGEIVGITGQAGHGRLGLAAGLLGMYPATGSLRVGTAEVPLGDPIAMERAGLSVVHEDRRTVGLDLLESVALNIAFPSLVAGRGFVRASWFPGGGFADQREMERVATELAERFEIRCESVAQPVGELSGGNQQKVAIARAVVSNPSVLIVAEPTRGIDVRAKSVVLEALRSIAAQGVAVVVVSGEIVELSSVCDRVIVVRDGVAVAEFDAPFEAVEIELAVLGAAASGRTS